MEGNDNGTPAGTCFLPAGGRLAESGPRSPEADLLNATDPDSGGVTATVPCPSMTPKGVGQDNMSPTASWLRFSW